MSTSSSDDNESGARVVNGRVDSEPTRRRFSLFGEGETGSPRRRLRAREMALVGAGGECEGEVEDSDGCRSWMIGKGSGDGARGCAEALGFALTGLLKGLERDSVVLTTVSRCLPLFF
jgi:hypothetical protein